MRGRSVRIALLLPFCLILIFSAACSKDSKNAGDASPSGTKDGKQPITDSPAEPAKGKFIAPLTGLPVDKEIKTRPIMVMINNHAKARPQSGLNQTDVLYELLAEAEITRFVAIFQSQRPEIIGPVRSIRPYFMEIGQLYDALIVHAGGSNDGYAELKKQHVEHLDEITNAGAYFWRDKSRKAPHNLYTSTEKIEAGAAHKGYATSYTLPSYTYLDEQEQPGGEASSGFDVTFLIKSYKVSYKYDGATGKYLRSINGKPHVDLKSGEQLSAANVIIMGTDHKVLDSAGRREVRLTGSGPAWVFRKGTLLKAEWERQTQGDAFRYKLNGEEIKLAPGNTHVLVVPLKPTFEGHITLQP